jgi:hypothetical protein
MNRKRLYPVFKVPNMDHTAEEVRADFVGVSAISKTTEAPHSVAAARFESMLDSQTKAEDPSYGSEVDQRFLMAMDIAASLAEILLGENTITPGIREAVRKLTNTDERESFTHFVAGYLLRKTKGVNGLNDARGQPCPSKRQRQGTVSSVQHETTTMSTSNIGG